MGGGVVTVCYMIACDHTTFSSPPVVKLGFGF